LFLPSRATVDYVVNILYCRNTDNGIKGIIKLEASEYLSAVVFAADEADNKMKQTKNAL